MTIFLRRAVGEGATSSSPGRSVLALDGCKCVNVNGLGWAGS